MNGPFESKPTTKLLQEPKERQQTKMKRSAPGFEDLAGMFLHVKWDEPDLAWFLQFSSVYFETYKLT